MESAYGDQSLLPAPNPHGISFRLFPRLPIELRLQIWKYAIHPRLIHFKTLYGKLYPRPPPLLLGACVESRQIALKSYELWCVCQQSRNCRPAQMRFGHIMYPWPPILGGEDNDDTARYRGRHHRYLDQEPACRCFPYVNFEHDIFVIDDKYRSLKKLVATRRQPPEDAIKIRNIAFSRWRPWIPYLRTITERVMHYTLLHFINLETVMIGVPNAKGEIILDMQEATLDLPDYGLRVLHKCKRKNPDWRMPTLTVIKSG